MHLFLCDRMQEGDLSRMEHQSLCRRPIEPVAYNRRILSIGMRCVNTQLMRSARKGIEIHQTSTVRPLLPNDITGNRYFAVLYVHHLPWSVIRIR